MFNVRLANDHLYGKQLFTWLSLVVSLMASFVLSFFPLDVVDEIWGLIESGSEGFLTYFDNFQVRLQYGVASSCISSNQFETFHRYFKHIENGHLTFSRQENSF